MARRRKTITDASFDGVGLYVQPGGNSSADDDFGHFTDDEAAEVRKFVQAGGRYLGSCTGAFLADASRFGLLPYTVNGYAFAVHQRDPEGASINNVDNHVIRVTWTKKGESQGTRRPILYAGGPYFSDNAGDGHTQDNVATYSNDAVAAVVVDGRVAVVGPHPEADEGWYDEAPERPSYTFESHYARDLERDLIERLGDWQGGLGQP